MGLEDIIKKIKDDTEKEIVRINEQTENEIKEMKMRYAEEIANFKENVYRDIEKKISEKRQRLLIDLELKIKKELLSKKWEIINGVFKKAYEIMRNLPNEERLKFITSLIKNAIGSICKSTSGENIEIYISGQDYQAFKERLQQVFKNVKIIENGNLSGGVVVRSGMVEANISFDAIFRKTKDELEPIIHNILFR